MTAHAPTIARAEELHRQLYARGVRTIRQTKRGPGCYYEMFNAGGFSLGRLPGPDFGQLNRFRHVSLASRCGSVGTWRLHHPPLTAT